MFFVLQTPSTEKNAFLWGYSASRIGLAGLILIATLFLLLLALRDGLDQKWHIAIHQRARTFFSSPTRLLSAALILLAVALSAGYLTVFFFTPKSANLITTAPIFQRILPLVAWGLLMAVQLLALLYLVFPQSFRAFPHTTGWQIIQPVSIFTIASVSLFYMVDQIAGLGISKEVGFHYWPFVISLLLFLVLAVLQVKYRHTAWFHTTVFYLGSVLVFFVFYFLYISTAEYVNYIHTPAKAYFPELAEAFLGGRLYLESPSATMDLTFHNGQWYVAFPPLAALVMMPLVARYGTFGFSTVIFTITFAAISVGLVYAMLESLAKLGWSKLRTRDNLWLVLLFGLGTIHWYMSIAGKVWYISRILTVTFVTLAVVLALRKRSPVWVGLALGLAIGARPNIVFTWPFLLGITIQHLKERHDLHFKNVLKWSLLSGLPILLAVAGLLWYNFIRFGDWLDFGYATMNVGDNTAVVQAFGQFNPAFIWRNIHYMLFRLPHSSASCNGRWVPDPQGISIFVTTPALIYLVRSFRRAWWSIAAWVTILIQIGLLLTHTGSAWEFGYRFIMDFMIPMMALLAIGAGQRVSWLMRVLILAGVVVNFIGVLWYFGWWCPS